MGALRRFEGKHGFSTSRRTDICPLRCTYIRHAAAGPNPNDQERALTPVGAASAVALGVKLRSLFGVPDLILSSKAKRAYETAVHLDLGSVSLHPELYLSTAEALAQLTQGLPQVKYVLVVAHNPGLSELLWRHAPRCSSLTPASGFQLSWAVEDWLLTGVEPPSGCLQFSASGGSNS